MHQKSGYVTVHVYRGWGVTIYPPYKKFRPRNFRKGKMTVERIGRKGFTN